jgi:cytochrome c oxidase accessory protein FixG
LSGAPRGVLPAASEESSSVTQTSEPVAAPDPVLSTLNPDGSRRRIRTRLSPGRFLRVRRAVSYTLMAVFFLLPYLRIGGKPSILLDLPRREFTLFGTTFLSTDTFLFMLLLVSCVVAILVFTALLGRVWCGWACPQTVYLEFLYRPIEHWLERGRLGSLAMDAQPGLHPRRVAKWAIYLGLSLFLAHTFLAYFVGVDQLAAWIRRSPIEHPTSFLVMLGTTAAIFLDFTWFREQTCIVACPYGRLQGALLDRRSLIVAYDPRRGEPRLKGKRNRPPGAGDCIDCRMCVITCPTGIDIREGLQMECVHCTQCMDACDHVMVKIGKPRGLIRYTSQDGLNGLKTRLLRPRVVLYPLVLVGSLGLLVFNLHNRAEADVTLLRGIGAPFTLTPDGRVTNLVRIKVANLGHAARRYRIELLGAPQATLIAPQNPLPVEAGQSRETSVFVTAPRSAFTAGELKIAFRLADGRRFVSRFPYELVGPEDEAAGEGHEERGAGEEEGR